MLNGAPPFVYPTVVGSGVVFLVWEIIEAGGFLFNQVLCAFVHDKIVPTWGVGDWNDWSDLGALCEQLSEFMKSVGSVGVLLLEKAITDVAFSLLW